MLLLSSLRRSSVENWGEDGQAACFSWRFMTELLPALSDALRFPEFFPPGVEIRHVPVVSLAFGAYETVASVARVCSLDRIQGLIAQFHDLDQRFRKCISWRECFQANIPSIIPGVRTRTCMSP